MGAAIIDIEKSRRACEIMVANTMNLADCCDQISFPIQTQLDPVRGKSDDRIRLDAQEMIHDLPGRWSFKADGFSISHLRREVETTRIVD